MSANKTFYRAHLWKDAPIFHQPFWLDAVAGDAWDVAIISEKDVLKAYYIYAFKKDATGFQIIMPKLTQFLGLNYKLPDKSLRERHNEETELLEQLLQQLPAHGYFESRWHFSFQNWLPFYWNGFHQTTRYTYVLEDLSDPEKLMAQCSDKIRREINKADKKFTVTKSDDVKACYQLLVKNFQDKHLSLPFDAALLERIYSSCKKNKAGAIWFSKDETGKLAACIFIVWDQKTAYYLIGGKEASFGNSGAMSQLFWHAFLDLRERVNSFDFEGSMIKGVESYFRSFGGALKGFFELSKINSPVQKLKASLRKTFRR